MAKVLYFNIGDNLDYEYTLLKEWGIDDLELIKIEDREYKKRLQNISETQKPKG